MRIVLVSIFSLLLLATSCKSTEQFFVARYGMINDVYQNGDHISTESDDSETVVTIKLRDQQELKITINSSFDDMNRKDLKTAEMVIYRPHGNKPLTLSYLKKAKLTNGKLTKEVYLDAQFSHGREHVAIQGRFPIKIKK